MAFDIGTSLDGKIELIDDDPYEILRYTGDDGGTASFFHAVGYLLAEYGLFQGDASTLRRLTATAIFTLACGPARALIRDEINRHRSLDVRSYIDALAAGQLPGDRVCTWAIEHHFRIRIELRPLTPQSLLSPQNDHFCPDDCDTMYLALRDDGLFMPMNHPELPPLIGDNYCLTCGVGVPNPLESICDDCVHRPRFCVSCRLVYVEEGSVCGHCIAMLTASLREDVASPRREIQSTTIACRLSMERQEAISERIPDTGIRPKFVVYLSNAPFDDFRSGDGTYINALVNWLNSVGTLDHGGLNYDVSGMRLCDSGLAAKIPHEEQAVKRLDIAYIKDWPTLKTATEKMRMVDWQERWYEPARKLFFEKLVDARRDDQHPKSVHIFHVQVRYPDSGALFNREFLGALAKQGFRIVVTCHEMKFNLLNVENMQRNVVQMNDFIACAERTIFLNEHDLMCSVKLVKYGTLATYYKNRKSTKRELNGPEKMRDKAATTLQELELAVEAKSSVHPSGHRVNTIEVPLRSKESFIHIPGIATVKGTAFNAEKILARPRNVLVFGLIKQTDAMEQTAAVARAIQNNPEMGNARVFVVGKVFKDFKHNAIATLVGNMCGLSGSETAKLCTKLDLLGDKKNNDRDFYTAMESEIHELRDGCEKKWTEFVKTQSIFIEDFLKALGRVINCDIKLLEEYDFHDSIQSAQKEFDTIFKALDPAPYERGGIVLKEFCKTLQVQFPKMLEVINPIDKTCHQQRDLVNTGKESLSEFQTQLSSLTKTIAATKKDITRLLGNEKAWPAAPLPVTIKFDASPEEFQDIAAQCKYAFKVDQKSMADNASSIISLMSNGCITFTESRYDTPNEFYKDNNGALSPVIMPPQKYGACDGTFVVEQILHREAENEQNSNRRTLRNMQTLLVKRYGLDAVAAKHLIVYKTLL